MTSIQLEIDTRRQLSDAWIVRLRKGDDSEGRATDPSGRASEVRCVEEVEELASNLEAGTFVNDELLEERRIQ